jgi:ubiquitin-like 1-activating enzyme E1 B
VWQAICPAAKIVAHHANIKETRFDVDFFRGFDIVLNGLDNLEVSTWRYRHCMIVNGPQQRL